MSFRPSIELLMVVLLLVFLAAGYKVLTEPGKYFPEAAPHAGQAFTELALVAGPTGVKGHRDAKGEDAQFSAPRAMAMDRAGNLYVLDTGNHALRKIQLDSTVSTVADLSGDVSPQFGDYPDGIAVDASGNVYIAEASNELILKVTPAGTKSVFAGQRGVEVLLENIPNAFSSGEKLNEFLASTHLNLNYCFDIGHANLMNGVTAEFEAMKERIRSTHIHDNDGKTDSHLFPGQGIINWKQAMTMLRSRQDQYPLLLELKAVAALEHPAEDAQRAADDLDKLEDYE